MKSKPSAGPTHAADRQRWRDFEPGSELLKQFDILSKVRERYPSAGLLAIGSGNLHFEFMYQCALHQDCNHIELTGTLSEAAAAELLQRANVLLQTNPIDSDSPDDYRRRAEGMYAGGCAPTTDLRAESL